MLLVQKFGQHYNDVMNRERIITLIEILRKHSDADHPLNANDLIRLLEENGVKIANRKTIYEDIRSLSDHGFDVENTNDGYYLSEAPFSLSEIKIISDSLNSLKTVDSQFLDKLNSKLYSFISEYEEEDLKKLEYTTKHEKGRFINRLEDTLHALNNNETLIIRRKNKKENEEIAPLFLHRLNDHYYLYYHYQNSDKIYHCRFDNITQIKLTDHKNDIVIPKEEIIRNINESTNAYFSKKAETIRFEIAEDSEEIRSRLQDDFPNIMFTRDGFALKVSVNHVLFSKLVAYGEKIKISDPKTAEEYIDYLKKIITRNSSGNRNKRS